MCLKLFASKIWNFLLNEKNLENWSRFVCFCTCVTLYCKAHAEKSIFHFFSHLSISLPEEGHVPLIITTASITKARRLVFLLQRKNISNTNTDVNNVILCMANLPNKSIGIGLYQEGQPRGFPLAGNWKRSMVVSISNIMMKIAASPIKKLY